MTRLPTPGSDDNAWGAILNDFLSVTHNPDGTIKSNTLAEAQLDAAVRTKLNDRVSTATTVNGHALNANVTLTAADIDAEPSGLSNATKSWINDTIATQITGVVVLDYGAAVPTSPNPAVLYLRKTVADNGGGGGAGRQSTPSLVAVGDWNSGSFLSGVGFSLTVPVSAQTGDLLMAVIVSSQNDTATMTSGWTQRITGNAGASSWDHLEVWTKTAGAGDPGGSVTMTLTGTQGKFAGAIIACTGVLDAVSTFSTSTTSTNSYTTPSLAVSTGALPIAILTDRAAGVIPPNDAIASSTWTPPAGWSIQSSRVSDSVQNGGGVGVAIAIGPTVVGTSVGGNAFTAQYTNTRGGTAIISVTGDGS